SVTLSPNYSDVDASDTHTFSVDTTGTLGAVTVNDDGTFSYDPNGQFEALSADETATDSFQYTVTDSSGATSTQTVTITIAGQNDGPIANSVTASTDEGSSVTLSPNYSDVDASDTHTFNVDTTGTLGSVVVNEDGTFSYDPNGQFEALSADETATDSFQYTVTDSSGATSTQTVTITIAGQNDGPIANSVAASTDEGSSVTLSPNYSDVDASDTHTFSVDTTGTLGAVTVNDDG
ncbi:Ig-like domain-containing protein, partial [Pseudovibrio sp. Ad14]|uniref:VCBS domain-containing protein n=1 Tax=Pseudovibrio sp. Ad14 TaxID=989397 RepID=UPI000AA0942F